MFAPACTIFLRLQYTCFQLLSDGFIVLNLKARVCGSAVVSDISVQTAIKHFDQWGITYGY